MTPCFIGVDVGTASARAGVFDAGGALLGRASRAIRIWRPEHLHAEQSSADIWAAVCAAVRGAMAEAGIGAEQVRGVGFDATCSLVVMDAAGAPLPVNAEGDSVRDIILWMDHRAEAEAEEINATGARPLAHVGGRISPEMEIPKILWLSRHLPQTYARAGHFMDLADWLTWRATGSASRSICTLACKWTWMGHEGGWDADFLTGLGLGALVAPDARRIGQEIQPPGHPIAGGLSAAAAGDLGLRPGTAIATGIIDAHAGAIGTIGAAGLDGALTGRLAYVFGTSACTLNVTADPVFAPGVWGPYRDALLPGLWLNEGGQSAAGAAIDHLVLLHPHATAAKASAQAAGQGLSQWLEGRARDLIGDGPVTDLLQGLHVVPEFLGNRAPFADPQARGVIAGLGLEADEASLIRLYLAGVASIGYGLRQIIGALADQGVALDSVVVSGGAAQSPLVRRILADATGLTIATVSAPEPVLLGAAMLGAVAAGAQADLPGAMAAMSRADRQIRPDPAEAARHDRRYAAFCDLQARYRDLRDC